MAKIDPATIIDLSLQNIRARTPVHTGLMKRSINGFSNSNSGDTIGSISIDVEYASFVNYGVESHPNSAKLQRDFQFVEKGIESACKIYGQNEGGVTIIYGK